MFWRATGSLLAQRFSPGSAGAATAVLAGGGAHTSRKVQMTMMMSQLMKPRYEDKQWCFESS
jgi:hypothetical protein